MKEKLKEIIEIAKELNELIDNKPSYTSALRGAEDCDDSYQEYLEWTWEYRDMKDTLKNLMNSFVKTL